MIPNEYDEAGKFFSLIDEILVTNRVTDMQDWLSKPIEDINSFE